MKREGVIVTTFLVDKPKQVKFFQVKIPREAENIVGVEMSLLWLEGVPPVIAPAEIWTLPMSMKRNLQVGELKFQSYEKANMCYTGELVINNNHDFADFTSKSFIPKTYTHQYPQNEDVLKINGDTTILNGVYRDKLSEHQGGSYKYIVKVYTWIAAKEDQTNL